MQALPATLLKERSGHKCFPVNSAKFLRTSFGQNTSENLNPNKAGLLGGIFSNWARFFKTEQGFNSKGIHEFVSFASYRYYTTSFFFLCYSWLVLTFRIYISKRGVGGMLLWIKPFLYGAVKNVDRADINLRRRRVIIFEWWKSFLVGWMERWWMLGLISGNSFFLLRANFFECILPKFQSPFC